MEFEAIVFSSFDGFCSDTTCATCRPACPARGNTQGQDIDGVENDGSFFILCVTLFRLNLLILEFIDVSELLEFWPAGGGADALDAVGGSWRSLRGARLCIDSHRFVCLCGRAGVVDSSAPAMGGIVFKIYRQPCGLRI